MPAGGTKFTYSSAMPVSTQIIWLFVLALPIACVAWTVTHEEVFREPREFCEKWSKAGKTVIKRKFFYLFTCEYCFSHYVTIFFVILTEYKLLMDGWRGYLIGGLALVWIANFYMSLFALIRIDLKRERTEIEVLQENAEKNIPAGEPQSKEWPAKLISNRKSTNAPKDTTSDAEVEILH